MDYQCLEIDAAISGETAKLYTYFLDNSPEIDPKRRRPVVLLCPGGAYMMTSDREAELVAMQFLAAGIQVAVLRYSVAPSRYPEALRQVAASVLFLRKNAEKFHILSDKIFVMGFSAGGHLAASYGVFWKKKKFLARELCVEAEMLRPNGLLLGYPVINSGEFRHRLSFECLLGEKYEELIGEMSLEIQVNADTPQTFLWTTETDSVVPVENSVLFYQALHAHRIPVELHIYPTGEHGLSLANEETDDTSHSMIEEHCQSWIALAVSWIKNCR